MARTSHGPAARPKRRGKQDPDSGSSGAAADKAVSRDEATAKTAPDATSRKNCPTAKSAAEFLPPDRLDLAALHKAASACQGCPLYCNATQTVFGEGPTSAAVMFVGEQPGDREDRAGKPFVGPAGQLLDEAMEQAGIPRDKVYVTNAVKHFKFEPRGTRRIHAKPGAREVNACRPWLEAEIAAVKPKMIVCLGATAAQSLMGKDFRVTRQRGEVLENPWAPALLATVHPSSLLRIPDDEQRKRAFAEFVDDLRKVARHVRT
jgi:uracil-DNA glycosylase